jgi:hypothetical protein
LTSGTISIDGVDVSKIGLNTLRGRIAIIPQDPVLFSGTLRSNLDPFSLYDDARLYDAMKRACLMEGPAVEGHDGSATPVKRFSLDTVIEDEGLNLSRFVRRAPLTNRRWRAISGQLGKSVGQGRKCNGELFGSITDNDRQESCCLVSLTRRLLLTRSDEATAAVGECRRVRVEDMH